MYELMADAGVSDEEAVDLPSVMEEAEDAMSDDLGVEEAPEAIDESAGEEDPLSELEQMKKDYFRPKPRERRPGTAIMVASMKAKPSAMSKMAAPGVGKPGNKYGKR